ncbi:hypothetical protein N9Z93_01675 [Akkermansiaceae bacterium]|nr:hypothetical protein [Akkermansiaceae bacterium]|tara:strand:+ start:187 stop:378 length:192 start_codon:yes stop_codon:yes gene_type:complete
MALQLTNEEQELLKKENESLREDVNELKSLSKITNKVQSVMLDEMEDLKKHTGFFNAIEKKED